jgi:Rap1a immunity proteins
MRKACLFLVVLMCGAVVPAHAYEGPWESGNAFLRVCSSVETATSTLTRVESIACTAYVRGLNDGFGYGAVSSDKQPPYCIGASPEAGQVTKIVLKYIRDNPAQAHLETAILYLDAMKKAFPCSSKK